MENNQLTQAIIGAAIEVHKRLGPWLLESAYRAWVLRWWLAEMKTQARKTRAIYFSLRVLCASVFLLF